jgi:FemAB-related protein (PEP-CTERM system-associated)
MRVREITAADERAWDEFVRACPTATLFHRLAWREVIVRVCRHQPIYLAAEDEQGWRGVLPLFVLRTGLFGTMAVSLPFLNYGGVAVDHEEASRLLLQEAAAVGRRHGCAYVEFRHRHAIADAAALPTNDFKVTSVLDLTDGVEAIWKSKLHQNVRNKIRKAEKSDVTIRRGADELATFARVFAANQRDHGTPALPTAFFREVLARFGEDVNVYAAHHGGRPIAAKLTVDFRDTRYFIWSASTRAGNQFAPVPAMNWTAIQDAAAKGLRAVDLGRSTKDTGSQSFKKYWGVNIEPLYWQYHLLTRATMPGLNVSNPKFDLAIRLWRRLPLFLTRWLGPPLARRLP